MVFVCEESLRWCFEWALMSRCLLCVPIKSLPSFVGNCIPSSIIVLLVVVCCACSYRDQAREYIGVRLSHRGSVAASEKADTGNGGRLFVARE